MKIVNIAAKYLFASTLLGIFVGHWLARANSEQPIKLQRYRSTTHKIIPFPQWAIKHLRG